VEPTEISSTFSDSRKIPWRNKYQRIYIKGDVLKEVILEASNCLSKKLALEKRWNRRAPRLLM